MNMILEPKLKEATLYEYGDGEDAKPLEEKVSHAIRRFQESHMTILSIDYHWIPEMYKGKNCLGLDTFKPRECYIRILYLDKPQEE